MLTGETGAMKGESPDTSYLALPDGAGPFPGVVVIHEASGLNDNIRDICARNRRRGGLCGARRPPTCSRAGTGRCASRECSRARWPGTSTTTAFRR